MKIRKKGNLYHKLQALSIFPLLALGAVIAFFSIHIFVHATQFLIKDDLSAVADTVTLTYDKLYPGDYELVGSVAYDLEKGGHVLNGDYSILDAIKEDTGMELTLFYQDTRILTTIYDEKTGQRIVGSGARDCIISDVLDTGEPHFYDSALINGEEYFAYYRPLFNSDGSVVGMMFVGRPLKTMNRSILNAVTPILILSALTALITILITSSYIGKIISSLREIQKFLARISSGNLTAKMSPRVLSRNDALSDIGHSAVTMQHSLRILVEQDPLTGLSNRRYGNIQLKNLREKADLQGFDFSVVIGDIDYFKKVNDTYGHDCGDVVLKKIADILKNHMTGKGSAIRWGGEEFLLLFENPGLSYRDSCQTVEEILNEIRNTEIVYDGETVRVTMTFGIVEGNAHTGIREILLEADRKLYLGKEQGRNRIIS